MKAGRAWLVLVPLLCTALISCGAIDDSAPQVTHTKKCKTLDAYLAPLDAQVAAGKLVHFGRIIREDLDRASLRAIVQLLLNTVRDLPAGTFEELAEKLGRPAAGDTIGPLLIAFLKPLSGDATATPPVAPRLDELTAISKVATACLDAHLFGLATEVLRDKRLKPAMGALLKGGAELGPALEKSLKDAGIEGRKATITLLGNIAVSIAAPDFDPRPLVDMLDGLGGDNETISALVDLISIALLDSEGKTDPARVATVSAFVGCFVQVDVNFALPGFFYDVVAGGALSVAFGATPTTAQTQENQLEATVAVLDVVSYLTASLATDQSARDALGQVVALLLRPELAIVALPEVVGLLESDALTALPSLLSDIATRPCLELAPQ